MQYLRTIRADVVTPERPEHGQGQASPRSPRRPGDQPASKRRSPLAPLDRIRQALKDTEQIARFDRALDRLANIVVEAIESNSSVVPLFEPRIHDGHLQDVSLTVRQTIR